MLSRLEKTHSASDLDAKLSQILTVIIVIMRHPMSSLDFNPSDILYLHHNKRQLLKMCLFIMRHFSDIQSNVSAKLVASNFFKFLKLISAIILNLSVIKKY